MRVRVRLFAALREAVGRDVVEMDLACGATPEDAWKALAGGFGAGSLHERRKNLAAAVNRQYARFDSPLQDGDEVVFIPPVSGG